jgi:hypothetical protein
MLVLAIPNISVPASRRNTMSRHLIMRKNNIQLPYVQ